MKMEQSENGKDIIAIKNTVVQMKTINGPIQIMVQQ